ncbi:MAG: PrgI family protein [bacterium]
MQFQVPQYIDVEDKIFGPFTFKQFIYLFGGVGGAFLAYAWIPTPLNFPVMALIGGAAAALTFYKVNNRPFSFVMEAAFRYFMGSKLYIWEKGKKRQINAITETKPGELSVNMPKISRSQLKDLAWSLDVRENIK